MSRGGLDIRDARPDDVGAILRLWEQWGLGLGQAPLPETGEAASALAHIGADPDERLLVGEAAGEVVCCLYLRRAPMTPLHTEMVLHTSYLLVAPGHRKHGYAHALLETAVAWAEEKNVETITAITSSARENNRFLARLGLMDVATIRASTTSALRHRLTPTRLRATPTRMRVLAQRRSMRRLRSTAVDGTVGATD